MAHCRASAAEQLPRGHAEPAARRTAATKQRVTMCLLLGPRLLAAPLWSTACLGERE